MPPVRPTGQEMLTSLTMRPLSGVSMPPSRRIRVDLPAPLGADQAD